MLITEFFGLYFLLAGYIIGLGAVTVIDVHGFLGRKSTYWTQTTIRAHKVTKPLIWLGMILALIGGIFYFEPIGWNDLTIALVILATVLILNGCFLSFYVSPYLLKLEKQKKDKTLLPMNLQIAITVSFFISFFCWWGSLALTVWGIMNN